MDKKINLLFIFLTLSLFIFSQNTSTLNWVGTISSSNNDSLSFLEFDNEGSTYIAGNFQNKLDLDLDTLKSDLFNSAGDFDIYITKTDNFGNKLWSQTIGGTGLDSILGLSVTNEKVYVFGYFEKELYFGVKKVSSIAKYAYFVATLDLSGNVLDVKTIQAESNKFYSFGKVVNDIVYFTGMTSNGSVFVERRTIQCEFVWLKQLGSNSEVQFVKMSNDEQANIYLAGNFKGINIDFDPSATVSKLSSSDFLDGFLLKLNINGDFVWVKQINGIKNDFITALAVRGSDLVVSGRFEERITFGSTSMLSKGTADFFVAQYDLNGNLNWARQFGGHKQSDETKSIVIDRYGNVYITGIFIGEGFEIGNGTLADRSVLNVNGKTSRDAFLIRIDSKGTTNFTTRFGGNGKDFGAALTIDNKDNLVLCGLFESNYGFEIPKLDGKGLRDVFVISVLLPVKTPCSKPIATITTNGKNSICEGESVKLITTLGTNYKYEWYNNGQRINAEISNQLTVSIAGVYSVKIINEECDSTSEELTITLNPLPIAKITPQSATKFCEGGFVNLLASGGDKYVWNNGNLNALNTVKQSGIYQVNVINGFGCQATASSEVIVYPLPIIIITPLPQFTLQNSSSVILNAKPLGGNFIGDGITNNQFNPSIVGLGKKIVRYEFISLEGCKNAAVIQTIVVDSIGTNCEKYDTILKIKFQLTTGIKAGQLTAMNVYPNPTSDVLIIEASDVNALKNYTYRIVNLEGKEVYKNSVIATKTEISLKTLGSKGIYVLHILDENGTSIENKKIVLE